jgi:dynein heavy chain
LAKILENFKIFSKSQFFFARCRLLVQGSRAFVRWMDGTCIETPPQNNPDSDEPYIFSFHSDIIPLPAVTDVCLTIMDNLQKTLLNCIRIAARWRKYKPIWKLDKSLVSEKFANKQPTCIDYDNKLQFYTKLVADVATIKTEEHQQVNSGNPLRGPPCDALS